MPALATGRSVGVDDRESVLLIGTNACRRERVTLNFCRGLSYLATEEPQRAFSSRHTLPAQETGSLATIKPQVQLGLAVRSSGGSSRKHVRNLDGAVV